MSPVSVCVFKRAWDPFDSLQITTTRIKSSKRRDETEMTKGDDHAINVVYGYSQPLFYSSGITGEKQ